MPADHQTWTVAPMGDGDPRFIATSSPAGWVAWGDTPDQAMAMGREMERAVAKMMERRDEKMHAGGPDAR